MTLFGSAELTRHSGIFLIECRCFLSREKPQPCVHNSYTVLMGRREFKISNFLKPTLATCHRDFAISFSFPFFLFFIFQGRADRRSLKIYTGRATMFPRNLKKEESKPNQSVWQGIYGLPWSLPSEIKLLKIHQNVDPRVAEQQALREWGQLKGSVLTVLRPSCWHGQTCEHQMKKKMFCVFSTPYFNNLL